MEHYYEQLLRSAAGDDHRRAGWRNQLEQAMRFAIALHHWRPPKNLLDLGCGPGGLLAYLQDHDQPTPPYFGIDHFAPSIERARERCARPDAFFAGDFHQPLPADWPQRFNRIVAIGSLVAGLPQDEARRRQELAAQLTRGLLLLEPQGLLVLICIDQQHLQEQPTLASEPALQGASADELESLCATLGANLKLLPDLLRHELVALITHDSTALPSSPDRSSLLDQTLDGPWGSTDPGMRAWLCFELGDLPRAADELASAPPEAGGMIALMRQKIALG